MQICNKNFVIFVCIYIFYTDVMYVFEMIRYENSYYAYYDQNYHS